MPWLYFSLKPRHRKWAEAWQREVQANFMELETIQIAEGCFVAPEARLFAEPGRTLVIGPGSSLADKVRDARAALSAEDVDDACEKLAAFAHEVTAHSGKKLSAARAADLLATAQRIRAVLAC